MTHLRAAPTLLLLLLAGCAALRGGAADPNVPDTPTAIVGADPSAPAPGDAPPAAVRPVLGGVVASAHPLASEAGASMLRKGGSAFDAAVATALVLGVVQPQSSGIGGGGFAVVQQDGETAALDFRETAPSFFDDDTYAAHPDRSSQRGPWSTGIPGEVAGLGALHARGGLLPWSEVVEPARALAADGFPVSPKLGMALEYLAPDVLGDPGMRAVFAPDGEVLSAGDTCVRPRLARTLEYIQLHGSRGFYEGPVATAITGFLAEQGVPWTAAELAGYEVAERAPLTTTYRGHTVHSMPPPSSGGIVTIQVLGMLERRDHAGLTFGSPEWTRLLAQGLSHSFADRATWLGDPDFVDIPVGRLVAPETLDRLVGALPAEGPVPVTGAGLAGLEGKNQALVPDDGGTSHLSVLDGAGNAVALTTTVNLWFGSGQLEPETGIVLNDELDDFTARPGTPNAFGLVQSQLNAPGPRKRPLSSMTPTLVTDGEGRVVLAVGGAGGPRIITGTLQTLLGVVDRGLSAAEAVAAPRMHHQWLPETVWLEESFPAEGRAALEAEGFAVEELSRGAVVQPVTWDPDTDTWAGAGDPRADGAAVVVPRP